MTQAMDYRGQILTNVRSYKRRASWGARVFILALVLAVVASAAWVAVLFKAVP